VIIFTACNLGVAADECGGGNDCVFDWDVGSFDSCAEEGLLTRTESTSVKVMITITKV
jgi:hypothetical protein